MLSRAFMSLTADLSYAGCLKQAVLIVRYFTAINVCRLGY